jgi:hypothetical protein
MTGTATTPFITALQKRALIGSLPLRFRPIGLRTRWLTLAAIHTLLSPLVASVVVKKPLQAIVED